MNAAERIAELKTIEDHKRLLSLIANDRVIVYRASNQDEKDDSEFKDHHLRFAVTCGDVFYYACTDFVEFDLADTAEMTEMFDKFGTTGLIAWCARTRNQKPIAELIDDAYREAFAYAAKFFASEYEYVLLCSSEEKPALDDFLLGVSHTVEVIDEKNQHYGYQAHLNEDQLEKAYGLASCIYRIHSKDRVKECKFRYFSGYSVSSTCEIVAKMIGGAYDINKGFYTPDESAEQA